MSKLAFRLQEPGQPARDVPVAAGMTIGRHPENGCVINDPKCSSRHAQISAAADGSLVIEDLGSSNKTIITGGPTLEKGQSHRLKAGDKILLGNTAVEVLAVAVAVSATQMVDMSAQLASRKSEASAAVAKPVEPSPSPAPAPKPVEVPPPPAPKAPDVPPPAPKPVEVPPAPKPVEAPPAPKPVEVPPPAPKPVEAPPAPKPVEVPPPQAAKPKPAPAPQPAADLMPDEATRISPAKAAPAPKPAAAAPAAPPAAPVAAPSAAASKPVKSDPTVAISNKMFEGIADIAAFKAANPRLVFSHEAIRKTVAIDKFEFIVGRSTELDVQCIIDHKAVSSQHARIRFRSKRFFIEDLGSTNHTFVGGEMLGAGSEREIKPDSLVRFGSIDALFVTDVDVEGKKTPQQRFASTAQILERNGTISKQQRMKVEAELRGKGESVHLGEALLLLALVSVEQWCDAFEHAKFMGAADFRSVGNGSKTIIIAVAAVLAALALAMFLLRDKLF